MTGDPNETEDILGFGDTDRKPRGRRPARLTLFLDRLTLRITRRPRLVAIAAGLAVALLAAGALTYFSVAHPAYRPPAASRPPAPQSRVISSALNQCINASRTKVTPATLVKLLKQLEQQAKEIPSPWYSSNLTIQVVSGGTYTINCP